jgi:hypothetical protein
MIKNFKMMKKLLFIILFFGLFASLSAQDVTEEIEGIITYISSQNVYVKFLSAKKIKPGDMIYTRNDNVLRPVMSVENSSSLSCVGKQTGDTKLKVGDKVIAIVPKKGDQKEQDAKKVDSATVLQGVLNSGEKISGNAAKRKQNIDGRLLLTSYSNISNLATNDSHRFRYTLSLNAANIGNSRLSFESYLSFAHKLNDWASIRENVFNGLKIYSLDLKYDIGKSTSVSLGRKINPQVSSIGAVDGFQFESKFKQFYFGAVAGFRPDYTDYSFDSNLLEYGAYIGHAFQKGAIGMQTSVAIFEQTNSGKTDRRFAYFQHQNSLVKNLNLFVSSELDLYKVDTTGTPKDSLMLTSLFVSLNYRPFKKLSLMASYDNRKNVIYYETFKNYLDQMLEDASRQGVQLRINYRPFKLITVGLSSSYRIRVNDVRPTQNLNGMVTYSQLPLINASATLSVNLLQTSYLSGKIYGLKLYKDFFNGKLNGSIDYRYVDYTFENSPVDLIQHIGEVDLAYYFTRKFSISVNYEATIEPQINYHRIYLSVVKRF